MGGDVLVGAVARAPLQSGPRPTMSEFEVRAEDLSVDHAQVVRNYRAAHAITLRREGGETSTGDLRQALVYYGDLFDELLEAHGAGKGTAR